MRRFLYLLCATALPLAAAPPADDAPAWLRQAAAVTAPKYDSKVKSLVLRDETRVSVEEGGKITTSTSYAKDGRPILQIIKTQDAHGHTEEKRVYGGKLLP